MNVNRARGPSRCLASLLAVVTLAATGMDDEGMGSDQPVATIDVCFDFGCASRTTLYLYEEDWGPVRAQLPGASSAADERQQVARAIGEMERVVGRLTPTGDDLGGNAGEAGARGQMDCIDESTNTTTYLSLFEEKGLLRFHRVRERVYRAPLIVDAHWAAQLEEVATGDRFVIDSWVRDNGVPAVVQTIDEWLRKVDPPPPPLAARSSRPR